MKNLILLLVCILTMHKICHSQKITKEYVAVSYTRLPWDPFSDSIKTYKNSIHVGSISSGLSRASLEAEARNSGVLNGYTKADDPDIYIKVTILDIKYAERQYNYEKKESKKKDGTVTTYYEHWYTYKYKAPVRLLIRNNVKDTVLFNKYIANSQDYNNSGTTARYRSSESLKGAWEKEFQKVGVKRMNEHLDYIKDYIGKRYGYTDVTERQDVRKVKPKKFDYPDLEDASIVAKEAYRLIEPGDAYITADAESKLREAMVIWNKTLLESDLVSKKARINKKVSLAIYYNLIYAHYWLGEFDKCEEFIGIVAEIGKPGWMVRCKNLVKAKKKRYMTHGLYPEKES